MNKVRYTMRDPVSGGYRTYKRGIFGDTRVFKIEGSINCDGDSDAPITVEVARVIHDGSNLFLARASGEKEWCVLRDMGPWKRDVGCNPSAAFLFRDYFCDDVKEMYYA